MAKTLLLTLLLCTVAGAQSSIVLGGGGRAGAGGTRAGAVIALDLDARHGKLEFVSRFSLDLAHKVGSDYGGTVREQALVRYGNRFRLGGGVGLYHVRGVFGSRTAVAPLLHLAYALRLTKPHGALLYATVRPVEWGTDYTREHRTRSIDVGVELTQRRGHLLFKEAFGIEALSYHNLDTGPQRRGAYAFVRAGIGYTW